MGAVRRSKTKRRTRDLDQVYADARSPKHLKQYKDTKADEDLPAFGEYYCLECAKWFESEHNMTEHRRGKNHKRRVRLLKETPYSQKEADAAVGLGVDNGKRGDPREMAIDEDIQDAALQQSAADSTRAKPSKEDLEAFDGVL